MTTPLSNARHSLGVYPEYEQAQSAVDHLSDQHFPVEHLSIIGRDLQSVEDVTGRLTVGRAALAGAGSGAWFGLLIGLIFLLVYPFFVLFPLLAGLLLGAAFGAVFGAVAHAMTGGRRDFASRARFAAERYEILVDAPWADEAARLLRQNDTPRAIAAETSTSTSRESQENSS